MSDKVRAWVAFSIIGGMLIVILVISWRAEWGSSVEKRPTLMELRERGEVLSEAQAAQSSQSDTLFGISPGKTIAATWEFQVVEVAYQGYDQLVTLDDCQGRFRCRIKSAEVQKGDVIWWDRMNDMNILYRGPQREVVLRLRQEAARSSATQPAK